MIADTINGDQFSGIGGHEDFVSGPALSLGHLPALPLLDLHPRGHALFANRALVRRRRVITTPRHQVDVIITEYGAAELQGKTVHQRGEALAAVAHPDYRDELLAAAERASHGHAPFE